MSQAFLVHCFTFSPFISYFANNWSNSLSAFPTSIAQLLVTVTQGCLLWLPTVSLFLP